MSQITWPFSFQKVNSPQEINIRLTAGQRFLEFMLLLLSRFSRVRLCATPETAAHQAPLSLGLQARTLEWGAISFSNA